MDVSGGVPGEAGVARNGSEPVVSANSMSAGGLAFGKDSEQSGELAALGVIEKILPIPPAGEVWAGDDAALMAADDGPLLVSVDLSTEGVHFDLGLSSLGDVGWKAVASAVSDIAAMGGNASRAFIGISCGREIDIACLYKGLVSAAENFGCPIAGGDLSDGGRLVISVTVTGSLPTAVLPALRSGAHPGDRLFVTGSVGGSACGLRLLKQAGGDWNAPHHTAAENRAVEKYRRPVARMEEGRIARLAGASAMIDISDGLAIDLHRMMAASETGAVLDLIPVFEGATIEEALGGGEDYELLMATADPAGLLESFHTLGLAPPLYVGMCTDPSTGVMLNGDPLPPYGYTHAFSGSAG
ncbi:MAG: thiamine-phosphate kinase [Actinobacteria bacterium]|nr:thiamine-phosphate kinase [Actinomycetota bacterium]MCL5446019.1 thiamine-phosphate kinase [Actinomycetota bacterium]